VIYLLAVGSNLQPEKHVRWMLRQMFEIFEAVQVGRFFSSKAYGIKSRHLFWNGAVIVQTSLNVEDLKTQLSEWEVLSGRDRSHPQCSLRDRTLDIDIVWSSVDGWYESLAKIKECDYLAVPLSSLAHFRVPSRGRMKPVFFRWQKKLLGARPVCLK